MGSAVEWAVPQEAEMHNASQAAAPTASNTSHASVREGAVGGPRGGRGGGSPEAEGGGRERRQGGRGAGDFRGDHGQ